MSEKEKNSNNLKKFINWVNADADLPAYVPEDEDDSDYDYEDLHEIPGEVPDAVLKERVVVLDALDEELDYSDMFTEAESRAAKEAEEEYPQTAVVTTVQSKKAQLVYVIVSVALALSIIAVLLTTLAYMPPFAQPDNPANNEVYARYIERGVEDTGAINIVAAILLDYRSFDTLGESFVLFTAAIAVLMMISTPPGAKTKAPKADAYEHPLMLRYAVMFVAPFVMIFGVYIILNGHLSPGGGFSGGAILGAGVSLYAVAYGTDKVRTVFNFKVLTTCIGFALLFYVLAKGYSFSMGASGLSTGIPLGRPGSLLSGGLILPLNIAVGLVVACTMYCLFAIFSEGEV